MTSLQDRLPFFVTTDALKETQRASWVWSEPRRETVGEHIWHCTLLAMLFADTAPQATDHDHVRDLLTIHDLVEVFAGDVDFLGDGPTDDVTSREQAAGERLISMLPEDQRQRFDPLWREFQAQETVEARFARAIDAVQPMVMAWYPGSREQPSTVLTSANVLDRKRPVIEPFPDLWDVANWLVQQAVVDGLISGDDMTPDSDLMSGYSDRLSFFVATDRLKETRRANWIYTEPRQETVAEHTWHASLLAMLLQDTAPEGTDHNHVRDLLVIHDLVEVFAGDTVLWDDVALDDVDAREHAAGERLMRMLPEDQYERFDPLWREFQAQVTIEARFARAIDSIHPMVVSWFPGAKGHANKTLTPTMILTRKRPVIEPFPELWGLANWLVQQAVDQELLPADEMVGVSAPS